MKEYGLKNFFSILAISVTLLITQIIVLSPTFEILSRAAFLFIVIAEIVIVSLLIFLYYDVFTTKKRSKKKVRAQQNIINALSAIYENVYLVNIQTNALKPCNQSSFMKKKYRNAFKEIKYEDAIKLYIENEVCEEDKHLFDSVVNIEKLKHLFEEKTEYSFIYRAKENDKIHFYQYFLFPADSMMNEVVLASKNVDEMMKERLNQEAHLTKILDSQAAQLSIISSISSIYLTTHLLDLKSDTVAELNTSEAVRKVVHESNNIVQQMINVINYTVTPDSLRSALEFTDLTTIARRMRGKKSISQEFEGKFKGWFRATFISVETDESGMPFKLLFATQTIDDEKRKEELLLSKANTDAMTKLENRRAYDEFIEKKTNEKLDNNLVIASLDVNGLKDINDTLGHDAGDELIRGAASCISKVFSPFGKTFRTGGDEFCAIILADDKKLQKIKEDFEQAVHDWTGKRINKISISSGYAQKSTEYSASIEELIKLADQRMYKEKFKHYAKLGINKHDQEMASDVLFKSYEKILKINLTTDDFSIIHWNEKIKNYYIDFTSTAKNFDTLTESDDIHEDDLEKLRICMNNSYLSSYFADGNKSFSIRYRKKVNGDFQTMFIEVIPSPEYSEKNQIVLLYEKNIHKQDL